VKAYRRDLEAFTEFCDRHYGGSWKWASVDRLGMRGFLGELQRRGLSKRTAARSLSAVRSVYRYLHLHHGVPNAAARAAKVPKIDKRLPTYLDRGQTERLFHWAEARAAGDEFGPTRDLAMLELFYSTGIRLSELSGMSLEDLDLLSDQAKVRGKGRKERLVPVGSRAVLGLRRYLNLREELVSRVGGDPPAGLVSPPGRPRSPRAGPPAGPAKLDPGGGDGVGVA
jgi:integrase/recombinase XerC